MENGYWIKTMQIKKMHLQLMILQNLHGTMMIMKRFQFGMNTHKKSWIAWLHLIKNKLLLRIEMNVSAS